MPSCVFFFHIFMLLLLRTDAVSHSRTSHSDRLQSFIFRRRFFSTFFDVSTVAVTDYRFSLLKFIHNKYRFANLYRIERNRIATRAPALISLYFFRFETMQKKKSEIKRRNSNLENVFFATFPPDWITEVNKKKNSSGRRNRLLSSHLFFSFSFFNVVIGLLHSFLQHFVPETSRNMSKKLSSKIVDKLFFSCFSFFHSVYQRVTSETNASRNCVSFFIRRRFIIWWMRWKVKNKMKMRATTLI